ncbi:MAG: ABC transporter ATP-binding protein, partial [Marinobacter sp.]|nr:ABC transporter ATP-binding protein [Marinobacter sp.]
GVEPYIDRAAILTDGALKAVGDLVSLRRQANMSVTLSIEPANGPSALERVIEASSAGNGLMIKKDNGRLQVDVRPSEKMALIQDLLNSGEVQDLGIHQPTLEDVYVHFIGSGGLAHRGGAQ